MSDVSVINNRFFNIPTLVVGMLLILFQGLAQPTLSGAFPQSQGGELLVATYEGYQSKEITRLRIGAHGQFKTQIGELPYEGFFLFELRDASGNVQLRFPVWLSSTDISVKGPSNGPYESLTFLDSYNLYFQQVSIQVNKQHDRLEWLSEGVSKFSDGKFQKQLTLKQVFHREQLKALYQKFIQDAPHPDMRKAIVFREQIDTWLHPWPAYFEKSLLTRLNWNHHALYRDPMPPEYVTSVLRHYLFHPLADSPEKQARLLSEFTLALVEATDTQTALGKSMRQLLRVGLNQIEGWDALELLDSLEGQVTNLIDIPESYSWWALNHIGDTIGAAQMETDSYLLVFWSPLCDHCISMLPVWAKHKREFEKKGIKLVGVTMDPDYLKKQAPQPEAGAFDLLLLDVDFPGPDGRPMSISDQFRFSSTPAYYLMGPGNRLQQRFRNWNEVKATLKE
jgi:hypothetical protein